MLVIRMYLCSCATWQPALAAHQCMLQCSQVLKLYLYVQALQKAADRIVDAIAASTAPAAAAPPAVAVEAAARPAVGAGRGASAGALNTAALLAPAQTPRDVEAAAVAAAASVAAELREADAAARMAAEWLALLAKGPVGGAAAQAALAGLAAAVIVCSSPRYETHTVETISDVRY